MQITITTIIFGLPTGQRTIQTRLTLPAATLQVRDLIAHKIRQEVAECAAHQRAGLSGEHLPPETLVTAKAPEALAPATAETEIYSAQRAFAAQAFMIVIDNRRVFDPDQVVTLSSDTRIEFIKILPLVGG
jgi:hypothetical protein